jgi:hypothetical protein
LMVDVFLPENSGKRAILAFKPSSGYIHLRRQAGKDVRRMLCPVCFKSPAISRVHTY